MNFCRLCGLIFLFLWTVVFRALADNDVFPTDFAGADVNIGERLFLETRFSQYFFTNSQGDANAEIPGDPSVATLSTVSGPVPGPFAGQAVNCRQCHIVDEMGYGDFGNHTLGNRTYADFARRSPVPPRDDGHTLTPRNSPGLVDALLPHEGPLFLHHDGQFASAHELIIATLTGRNYGWKPSEYETAVHHIANIIRDDDGWGDLAFLARGGRFAVEQPGYTAYRNVFSGFTDYQGSFLFDPRALITDLISPQYQIDMRYASDEQIVDTVASLIEVYLHNLTFSQATNGVDFLGVGTPIFNGSPFDVFLIKNGLPQLPEGGETSAQYSQRLLQLVNQLSQPQFVTDPDDGSYSTHTQQFVFGATELEGLKIFLRGGNSSSKDRARGVGNCAACHTLPAFTDFIFHNTGATQEEYDAIHGRGSFKKVIVPGLSTRQTNYDAYLPATPYHPDATGKFEAIPSVDKPGETDLGLWNVYANPDFPSPQSALVQILPKLMGLTTPLIDHVTKSGNRIHFSGTNGPPQGVFYILMSTNMQPSTSAWTAIATNTFDRKGNFDFTTLNVAGTSQAFYKLSLQMPTPAEVLPRTIALFKTPTLRDLSQSDPYLHTGRMKSIEDVIRFYQTFSRKARNGDVRNSAPELRDIFLNGSSITSLAAFLRSLNEDYTD